MRIPVSKFGYRDPTVGDGYPGEKGWATMLV